MRRESSGLPIQPGGKALTNFLAERRVMEAANPIVTFVRDLPWVNHHEVIPSS
jgi:hypothetical protein